jgi:hypothetical protein
LPRLWPPSGGLKLPQLAGPCQQMRLSFFQTVIDPFGSEILPLERYSRRQSSFNGMSEQRRVSANPNRVTRPNPTSLEILIDQLLLWGCLTRGRHQRVQEGSSLLVFSPFSGPTASLQLTLFRSPPSKWVKSQRRSRSSGQMAPSNLWRLPGKGLW